LDLFEILFRIGVYRNDSGFTTVGVMVLASMFWEEGIVLLCLDWKKGILTLPTITIRLISPGALFCLYFELRQTSHGTSLVSAFPQDLRMRSLRGEYCYVP